MKPNIYFLLLTLLLAGCRTGNSDDDIERIDTLVSRNCRIEYPVYKNGAKFLYEGHSIPNEFEYNSAQRKLAICLCEEYLAHPNDTLKMEILNLYEVLTHYPFGEHDRDIPATVEFDSIVSQRNRIFDPTIVID
ncbi:MAG: hypothetical protein ACTHJT_11345 [Cytophaga sp.]|uniref:hypothetical protein n=1 Tax=Cytophaga sp. TaxID=29535 RepID=UPI003F7DE655